MHAWVFRCRTSTWPANWLVPRGYSAHEHSTLYSNARSSLPSSPTLPLDITIEALAAVLLVSSGLVLGAEKLKPISWNVWAGEIEREGGSRNPYNALEYRPGFWDVRVSIDISPRSTSIVIWPSPGLGSFRSKLTITSLRQTSRKEFSAWIRSQGESSKTTKSWQLQLKFVEA